MLDVQVKEAMQLAKAAAEKATAEHLEKSGGRDCCGFAWVNTYEKGTTKLVRELKKHGFDKSWSGGYTWWNPSGNPTQCITAKEVGAEAAAKVLEEKLGVKFYAESRLD